MHLVSCPYLMGVSFYRESVEKALRDDPNIDFVMCLSVSLSLRIYQMKLGKSLLNSGTAIFIALM